MEKMNVVVVGSGIAGLSFSIYLAEQRSDLEIAVFTKSDTTETNTRYAQGGIAGVLNLKEDSFQNHIDDTLEAGGFECNEKIVEKIIYSAPERIRELENWGVNFNTKSNGEKDAVLEGGHSFPRVVHSNDSTGNEIENTLLKKIKSYKNIHVYNDFQVIELIKSNEEAVKGLIVLDHLKNRLIEINTQIVVLATGGCGQIFQFTTNPKIARGEGVFLAHSIGAKVEGMNNIQFHPTAFYEKEKSPLFLISEAVRGAGAHIINEKEERFVFKTDCRGELATRDIVTKCILEEFEKQKNTNVFLDCRHIDFDFFKTKFPMIFSYCKEKGLNLQEDCIPIIPAAHYQCGGIVVNEFGETSISNLFALGECSNTGMHGKNRLASNSLLEAIAFAKFAADFISNIKAENVLNLEIKEGVLLENSEVQDDRILKIQEVMYKSAIIGAEKDLIEDGIKKIAEIQSNNDSNISFSLSDWQFSAMHSVSNLILQEMKEKIMVKSIENI